jgi:hypothetical protein
LHNNIDRIFYSLKVSCKVLVGESGRVVFLHKVHHLWLYSVGALPVAPEPLGDKPRDGKDAKVDKDTDLGAVVPLGMNDTKHQYLGGHTWQILNQKLTYMSQILDQLRVITVFKLFHFVQYKKSN